MPAQLTDAAIAPAGSHGPNSRVIKGGIAIAAGRIGTDNRVLAKECRQTRQE